MTGFVDLPVALNAETQRRRECLPPSNRLPNVSKSASRDWPHKGRRFKGRKLIITLCVSAALCSNLGRYKLELFRLNFQLLGENITPLGTSNLGYDIITVNGLQGTGKGWIGDLVVVLSKNQTKKSNLLHPRLPTFM